MARAEPGASQGVAGKARRKCLYLLVLALWRNEVQRRHEARLAKCERP